MKLPLAAFSPIEFADSVKSVGEPPPVPPPPGGGAGAGDAAPAFGVLLWNCAGPGLSLVSGGLGVTVAAGVSGGASSGGVLLW